MKKIHLNPKYTTISVYVLLVILFGIVLLSFFLNFEFISNIVSSFFNSISCLFYGIFFTFCFLPLAKFLENQYSKKIKSKKVVSILSVISVYVICVGLILTAVIAIFPEFIDAYQSFKSLITPQIESMQSETESSSSNAFTSLWNIVYNSVSSWFLGTNSFMDTVTNIVTKLFSSVYAIALGLVLSAYFLMNREYLAKLSNKLLTAYLKDSIRTPLTSIVSRVYFCFVEFFSFRLIDGLAMSIIIYLFTLITKIPYGIVIAVLVFFANFIPVFGPIVAVVTSGLFLTFFNNLEHRFLHAGITVLILTILFLVSSLFLEPMFQHKKLRPAPGIVITSVILTYALFGWGGIIFAVPLYASLEYSMKDFLARKLVKKSLPLIDSYYLTLTHLDPVIIPKSIIVEEPEESEEIEEVDEELLEEDWTETEEELSESASEPAQEQPTEEPYYIEELNPSQIYYSEHALVVELSPQPTPQKPQEDSQNS